MTNEEIKELIKKINRQERKRKIKDFFSGVFWITLTFAFLCLIYWIFVMIFGAVIVIEYY